jgi:hypothetical protein
MSRCYSPRSGRHLTNKGFDTMISKEDADKIKELMDSKVFDDSGRFGVIINVGDMIKIIDSITEPGKINGVV